MTDQIKTDMQRASELEDLFVKMRHAEIAAESVAEGDGLVNAARAALHETPSKQVQETPKRTPEKGARKPKTKKASPKKRT